MYYCYYCYYIFPPPPPFFLLSLALRKDLLHIYLFLCTIEQAKASAAAVSQNPWMPACLPACLLSVSHEKASSSK